MGSNSVMSSQMNALEQLMQTFCKQMLKTKVFQGFYQERRYVDKLGYRDLIILDETEKELKSDLRYIRQKISSFYMNDELWVGITLPDMIGAPAAGICVWTEVENLAFGRYWFYVKSVRFRKKEVMVKLKVLRPADDQCAISNDSKHIEINIKSFQELLKSWQEAFMETMYIFFSQGLTRENFLGAIRFILILMLSLMTASIHAVKFLGMYSLLLMKELRLWVYTCTPIIIKIIDLILKVIGGLFIILSMVYRDVVNAARGQPPTLPVPSQRLQYRSIKGY